MIGDKFCFKCGFPLEIVKPNETVEKLESFFIDVESGVIFINGKQINNVTAFSLQYDKGKYGLNISHDNLFKSTSVLDI